MDQPGNKLHQARAIPLEARVTAKLAGHYSYGAFGAYAVGAVQLDRNHACSGHPLTGRVFALCSAVPCDSGGEPLLPELLETGAKNPRTAVADAAAPP